MWKTTGSNSTLHRIAENDANSNLITAKMWYFPILGYSMKSKHAKFEMQS